MGRPVMLANGSMMVGLDEFGLVHDFYYPYIGLENLTTARSDHHKIGVWVDGEFAWTDDGSWQTASNFESEALISDITMLHETLGISLRFKDFIDAEHNIFCRLITVVNHTDASRDVRLFMHQVFEISRNGRADTALYVPEANYLLDYKGRCSLLIYGRDVESGQPFDQYAIGEYGRPDKEGTFRDAEDGELSNNPVEHGGVDSVMRLKFDLPAKAEHQLEYWIAAAGSQSDAEALHEFLLDKTLKVRLEEVRDSWRTWIDTSRPQLDKLDPEHADMVKRSLLVIKSHIDVRGSILASGDSSIFNYGKDYYCYCWPRDGAYAVWPLIRLGYYQEAKNFFEFCRDILHPQGYLMHKYQPDRAIGSTWHPLVHNNRRELAIQEDETASVLIMLGEYLEASGDKDSIELLYDTLVRPAATFMASFIDVPTNLPHASYDLWEEKFLTTSYSVATTYKALKTAAQLAELFNFPDDAVKWRSAAAVIESSLTLLFDPERQAYRKGFLLQADGNLTFDNTLDVSSFYGMFMFGPKSAQENVDKTVKLIEEKLFNQSPSGGTPRYENDWYMRSKHQFLGNPWFVCTMWLAQYYIEKGQAEKGRDILRWAQEKSFDSGIIAEQMDPETGFAVGVAPLVWSHAEYINTALDIAGI